MNCNLLFYMFNALCFSVGVELAVSVSFICFVCFRKQIAFSCVMDRYLFVWVHCRFSRKNSHNNENFYHYYTPLCHSKPVWLPFRAALFNENRWWFTAKLWTSLFAFHRWKKIIQIWGWINDVKMWTISVTDNGMSKNEIRAFRSDVEFSWISSHWSRDSCFPADWDVWWSSWIRGRWMS